MTKQVTIKKDPVLNSKALASCFVFSKNVHTEEKAMSINN